MVKNLPANAGDTRDPGLAPGSGRFPGGENGNPLQYFCLENPMDRGTWRVAVHELAELDMTEYACNAATQEPNPFLLFFKILIVLHLYLSP